VLFSASRSRRSYYILPAVPWCILFTAAWFSEPHENWTFLRKFTDVFAKLVDVLIPVAAGLLVLASVAAGIFLVYAVISGAEQKLFPSMSAQSMADLNAIAAFIAVYAFLSGIFWLVFWRRSRKRLLHEGAEGVFAPSADPLNRVAPLVAFVLFTVFSVVIPSLSEMESFESTAPFLRRTGSTLKTILAKDPGFLKRTAFFGSVGGAELTYYLDLPEPIRAFSLEKLDDSNRTFTDDTVDIQGPDEFRAFLADVLEHGGMVITRGDWVAELKESEEGQELLAMLQDDEMVLLVSPMNIMQEQKLKKLREKPGWPDDPALMRKYKKLDTKRVYVFYHLSEAIAQPAEADAAEGTPQP